MFFHQLDNRSDGMHNLSCACRSGPSRGWFTMWIILPYVSCHDWNGLIIPCWYFYTCYHLRKLSPQFPWVRKFRIYPCRQFPRNPRPVDRLVSPTHWGRRGVESYLVILGKSSLKRLNKGRVVGSYLVTSVLRRIFL